METPMLRKYFKTALILIILSGTMLYGANAISDIIYHRYDNQAEIELVFEQDKIDFDVYGTYSPPQITIDLRNCENNFRGKKEYVSYSPLYLYKIVDRYKMKNQFKVIFDFSYLPKYSVYQDGKSIFLTWELDKDGTASFTENEYYSPYKAGLNNKVSLQFSNAPLANVLRLFAIQNELNVVNSDKLEGTVTLTLTNVRVHNALDAILKVNGYNWFQNDDVIIVKAKDDDVAGELMTQVYRLTYVDGQSVSDAIENVLTNKGKVTVYSPAIKGGQTAGMTGGAAGGTSGTSGGFGSSGFMGGGTSMSGMGGTGGTSGGAGMMGMMSMMNLMPGYDMILVTDVSSNFTTIDKIISQLDVQIPQINISVKFVETKLDITENMGINWSARASLRGGPGTAAAGFPLGNWQQMAIATLSAVELSAVFDLLTSSSTSKITQQPQTTTFDNQMAIISVGTTYPVTVTQPATQYGPPTTTYEEQEVQIMLMVTPRVNDNNYISMAVNAQVEAVTGFTGENADRPIVSTRTANTNIRVKDKETLLIGGLILEQDIETVKRVPFFSRIPIIKHLFIYKSVTPERSELMIFITPTIVQ
jgi:type II secretory pathway component GspD/PulD (secretin)